VYNKKFLTVLGVLGRVLDVEVVVGGFEKGGDGWQAARLAHVKVRCGERRTVVD
jgi:hypothetical protein